MNYKAITAFTIFSGVAVQYFIFSDHEDSSFSSSSHLALEYNPMNGSGGSNPASYYTVSGFVTGLS